MCIPLFCHRPGNYRFFFRRLYIQPIKITGVAVVLGVGIEYEADDMGAGGEGNFGFGDGFKCRVAAGVRGR